MLPFLFWLGFCSIRSLILLFFENNNGVGVNNKYDNFYKIFNPHKFTLHFKGYLYFNHGARVNDVLTCGRLLNYRIYRQRVNITSLSRLSSANGEGSYYKIIQRYHQRVKDTKRNKSQPNNSKMSSYCSIGRCSKRSRMWIIWSFISKFAWSAPDSCHGQSRSYNEPGIYQGYSKSSGLLS